MDSFDKLKAQKNAIAARQIEQFDRALDPNGLFATPRLHPQQSELELVEARREVARLQAFKDYVHKRLDAMGVPVDPESPHKAEGCRIGGRLDWIEQQLAGYVIKLDRIIEIVEKLAARPDEQPIATAKNGE